MAKKDIFKIDNYFIGIGVFFFVVGFIGFIADPRTHNDLTIIDDSKLTFENFEGRTLEEVKAEKGPNAEVYVSEFPYFRVVIAGSGLLMFIIGMIYRQKEKKIISIWDALERTKESNISDLTVNLGLSRDFILQNLKYINAQQSAYYVYVSAHDSIIDGRLMEEHMLSITCGGCGNNINKKVKLADLDNSVCPYCDTAIPVDELSKVRRDVMEDMESEVTASSNFSVGLFIVLLIVFWPAALAYFIYKKVNVPKKTIDRMSELQRIVNENYEQSQSKPAT